MKLDEPPGACCATAKSAEMRLKTAAIVEGVGGGGGGRSPPPNVTSRRSLAPDPSAAYPCRGPEGASNPEPLKLCTLFLEPRGGGLGAARGTYGERAHPRSTGAWRVACSGVDNHWHTHLPSSPGRQ